MGEMIWFSEKDMDNITTINITNEPSGTYFCKISNDDLYFIKQLIITK